MREAALQNYKNLGGIFGEQWIFKYCWPVLTQQQNDISYLNRLTILFGIVALADSVSVDTVKTKFMPMLSSLQKDPVANVRLNVAKTLSALSTTVKQNKDSTEQAKLILKSLQADKDRDVTFYAQKALKLF